MAKVYKMKREISDVVKFEVDYRYTRDRVKVTASGADVEVICGTPFVQATGTKLTETKAATPAAWTAKLSGEFKVAVPEVYTIKVGGQWAADDTLVIGSTTFTAKANPTVASNQFSANGSGAVIVADIKEAGLTVANYTISYDGDTIILTQSTPGTGDAPTCTPSSTAGTAVLTNVQNYRNADTFTVGSTTVTVVASDPSTNQVKAGSAAEVAEAIIALGLTVSGYTLALGSDGSSIVFTQASASDTETPPTFTTTSATGNIATNKTVAYAAAVSGNTSSIDCIALENVLIPDGTTYDLLVLKQGPAIVDIDQLEGVTDKEAMKARLASLYIKATDDGDIYFQRT